MGLFRYARTTFLPIAGPWGTALGIAIGAAVLFVIGINYHYLMKRSPSAGGAYSYTKAALGYDHGFLAAWMLLLTYVAIIWANATALALIARFVFGDLSTESYFVLAVWSFLGILVFRMLLKNDKAKRIGRNEAVWVVLLLIILVISVVWIRRAAADESDKLVNGLSGIRTGELTDEITGMAENYSGKVMMRVIVNLVLIGASLIVVFSIFSTIKKREAEAETAKMEAEQLARAKSIFLSNMSHNIRTPMNAITGYTALALGEDGTPPAVRGYLEKIDGRASIFFPSSTTYST